MTKPNRTNLICFLLIIIIGFAIYANTLASSFHFDDNVTILRNPAVKNLHDLRGIWDAFNMRFITGLTFAVNYSVGGLNPFDYHLLNILIHIFSAISVYLLVQLTFSTPGMENSSLKDYSRLISLFSALIFVSHPLQTEAVTYIWQRTTSLASLFYLLAVFLYVKSRLSGKILPYIGSLCMILLAMFTKEIAATLPLTILLYEYVFFGPFKKDDGRRYRLLVPILLTILIIPVGLTHAGPETVFMRGQSPKTFLEIADMARGDGCSRPVYFITQFRVIVTYIRLLFLPVNQNLDYDYPPSNSFFEWQTFFSFLFLAAILVFAILYMKRSRLISFGILWFFLTLSVESSLIPLADIMLEHRLYLPMVGFAVCLTTALAGALRNKRLYMGGLAVIVLLFSILAYARNGVWKDDVTLWKDVLEKSPGKARPYSNLGQAYKALGRGEEAVASYRKAIQIRPDYARAHYNMGNAYLSLDRHEAAIDSYRRAIEIKPDFTSAHYNLGNAYSDTGRHEEAIVVYRKAIELKLNYPQPHNNLGNAYLALGRREEAIASYRKAIELDPDYAKAHGNLALLYYGQKRYDLAIHHCERARELGYSISPDFLDLLEPHRK